MKVKCPGCGKPAAFEASNPYRPFCSERCKLIDLGAWADEKYAIPVKSPPTEEELEAVLNETDEETPEDPRH